MTVLTSHDQFIGEMTAWLNSLLAERRVLIDPDTPLFEGGLINSLRVLEVIAWVERATGRQIPDREMQMDNFATVRRTAVVFGPSSADADG